MSEGLGSLHEVQTKWSLKDLVLANEWLDMKQEAEAKALKQARQKARRK